MSLTPDDELELLTLGFRRHLVPGTSGVLWTCETCGALVGDLARDLARHREWHREEGS